MATAPVRTHWHATLPGLMDPKATSLAVQALCFMHLATARASSWLGQLCTDGLAVERAVPWQRLLSMLLAPLTFSGILELTGRIVCGSAGRWREASGAGCGRAFAFPCQRERGDCAESIIDAGLKSISRGCTSRRLLASGALLLCGLNRIARVGCRGPAGAPRRAAR